MIMLKVAYCKLPVACCLFFKKGQSTNVKECNADFLVNKKK
jgi:hypothetical protein